MKLPRLPRLPRLSEVPASWRWGGLVTLVLLVGFFGWLLFLRPGGNSPTPISPAPAPQRPALGKTITYSDYAATVKSALGEVRAAIDSGAGSEQRKQHTESAASLLEKVEGAGVAPDRTAGAPQVEIDNTSLIAALRDGDADLEAVAGGLQALASALDNPATGYIPSTAQWDQANGRLRQVLRDPTFAYQEHVSPLQQLVLWLTSVTNQASPDETLSRLLMAVVGGLAAGALTFLLSERLPSRGLRLLLSTFVGLVVAVVSFAGLQNLDRTLMLLGAVGLVVAAVVAGVFVVGVRRGSTAASTPRAVSDLAAVLGMNSVEARGKAEASAAAGDYRSAIRYRCLAVLLALDEAGKLTFDRSATNREYLFRATGTLHDELQPLLDRFDDVWYGGVPVGPAEWTGYASRAQRVEGMIAVQGRSAA